MGGDEYIILIRSQDKKIALKTAEGIRKAIQNFLFDEEERLGRKITASIGLADYNDIDVSLPLDRQIKDVIKKADDALFHSKRTGRNKITVWDTKVPRQRN